MNGRHSFLKASLPTKTIGDFGLVFGGAAGDELDRIDYGLGTPHHTLLLASSEGHGPSISPVIEDFLQLSANLFLPIAQRMCAPTWSTSRRPITVPSFRLDRCAGARAYPITITTTTFHALPRMWLKAFSKAAELPPPPLR